MHTSKQQQDQDQPHADTMSERELFDAVTGIANGLGLWWWHDKPRQPCQNCGHPQPQNKPGWPDLVFLGQRGMMTAELKSERGRLSLDQLDVTYRLSKAGVTAAVWRPCHLYNGEISTPLAGIA